VSCAHRRARYWSPWSSKPEGREDEAGLHSKQAEDASSRKGLPATGSSTKKSGWPKGEGRTRRPHDGGGEGGAPVGRKRM
jgi:hypothetical protein